jgi:hypothetical protein
MAEEYYAHAEEGLYRSNLTITSKRLELAKRPSSQLDFRHQNLAPKVIVTHLKTGRASKLHLQSEGVTLSQAKLTQPGVIKNLLPTDDAKIISKSNLSRYQTNLKLIERRSK